jgi:hypothetical protein
MTHIRMLLAMIGGAAAAYTTVALIPPFGLTIRDVGIGAAITASCWLLIGLLRFVERQQQRDLDKAIHPSTWRTP